MMLMLRMLAKAVRVDRPVHAKAIVLATRGICERALMIYVLIIW